MNSFQSLILFLSLTSFMFLSRCSSSTVTPSNNANISTATASSPPKEDEKERDDAGTVFESPANGRSILFSSLPVGSSCIITEDSHDTWVSWSPDDKQLAFISAVSGEDNLYLIKIDDLNLLEAKEKNLYVAEYLVRKQARSEHYVQKTFSTRDTIDGPEWSPDGKTILLRTYDCSSAEHDCKDYQLLSYDLEKGATKTIFRSDVMIEPYCWLDNHAILLTTADDQNKIHRLDVTTLKRELLLKYKDEIKGFTVDEGDLIIAATDSIGAFNLRTRALESYGLPFEFTGTRIGRYSRKIILTAEGKEGPAAGWYDIDRKETELFLDSYDYEPTVSNTKRYVAFISEGIGGIAVKRLQ